ncbi:MAG: FliA/WhiG family RNA polymerase sigma factor [Nitrospirae bacterium]|nr:FliA/WhiG family RNA polymerase sigma factor [Nitrospirota bacterium]
MSVLQDHEKLIEGFVPLIRFIAFRFSFRLPPSMDMDDLVSAGILGLMDAAVKYDSTKEVQFRTYAEFRIRGAMLDEIRRQNWVPRSVHDKMSMLQKTQTDLTHSLGRPPSIEELAGELKMTLEEMEKFMADARSITLISLEDLGLDKSREDLSIGKILEGDSIDPLLGLLNQERKEKLVQAVHALAEKEQWVISFYYVEELTMKQIGQILEVSESRVCQIHTQAILKLKTALIND